MKELDIYTEWTNCPKCENERKQKLTLIEHSYGKVPPEEYSKMLNEYYHASYGHMKLTQTYKQGIVGNIYKVDFSAKCSDCDWTFSYYFMKNVLGE